MNRNQNSTSFFSLLGIMTLTGVVLISCVPSVEDSHYTYRNVLPSSPSLWSPAHRSSTLENAVYQYTESPLINFVMNDEKNGYKVIPEMAEKLPSDVTDTLTEEEIKRFDLSLDSNGAKFSKGQKWLIELNKNAVFEDGTSINADTYIESLKRILDPKMQTRRASDYTSGKTAIANGDKYLSYGKKTREAFLDKDGKANKKEQLEGWYFNLYEPLPFFDDLSFFELIDKYLGWNSSVRILINDERTFGNKSNSKYVRIDNHPHLKEHIYKLAKEIAQKEGCDNFPNKIEKRDAKKESYSLEAFLFADFKNPEIDFKDVGIQKANDYSFYYYFTSPISDYTSKEFFSRNWIMNTDLWDKLRKPVPDSDMFSTTYATSKETYLSYGPYKLTFFQADKKLRMERNDKWIGYKNGLNDGKYQIDSIDYEIAKNSDTALQLFRKGEIDSYGIRDSDEGKLFASSKRIIFTPGKTAYRLILNSVFSRLKENQEREGKGNHTILSNKKFREALSIGFDRKTFCQTQTAAWTPFCVPLSMAYLSDPEANVVYRDTEEGKKVVTKYFGTDSNGEPSYSAYDAKKAKALINEAVNEEMNRQEEGAYRKGEKVHLVWESPNLSGKQGARFSWIVKHYKELMKETLLERKFDIELKVTASAMDGPAHMRAGSCDLYFSGWSGNESDPFDLMTVYAYTSAMIEPYPFYSDSLEIDLDSGEYSANKGALKGKNVVRRSIGGDGSGGEGSKNSWIYELNGGKYSALRSDDKTRLKILAALEGYLVSLHNFVVCGTDQGMVIDSYRLKRGSDKYIPMIGFGGMREMRLSKSNGDWKKWVSSHSDASGYIDYNK